VRFGIEPWEPSSVAGNRRSPLFPQRIYTHCVRDVENKWDAATAKRLFLTVTYTTNKHDVTVLLLRRGQQPSAYHRAVRFPKEIL